MVTAAGRPLRRGRWADRRGTNGCRWQHGDRRRRLRYAWYRDRCPPDSAMQNGRWRNPPVDRNQGRV